MSLKTHPKAMTVQEIDTELACLNDRRRRVKLAWQVVLVCLWVIWLFSALSLLAGCSRAYADGTNTPRDASGPITNTWASGTALSIMLGHGEITIEADGHVKIGKGLTLDQASRDFWKAVENNNPLRAENGRLRRELVACKSADQLQHSIDSERLLKSKGQK